MVAAAGWHARARLLLACSRVAAVSVLARGGSWRPRSWPRLAGVLERGRGWLACSQLRRSRQRWRWRCSQRTDGGAEEDRGGGDRVCFEIEMQDTCHESNQRCTGTGGWRLATGDQAEWPWRAGGAAFGVGGWAWATAFGVGGWAWARHRRVGDGRTACGTGDWARPRGRRSHLDPPPRASFSSPGGIRRCREPVTRWIEESSGGCRAREGVGEETGLPLVQCPYCGKARVFERRSKKDNMNHGRVYFKCPRGVGWMPDKCDYYRWQREYLNDLVDAKVIKVFDREHEPEIEEEDQSVDFQPGWLAQNQFAAKCRSKMWKQSWTN